MNEDGQIEMDRRVLNSILTLLLALADLAEAAARQSQAVRCLVFFVLVPAESVARDLLAGIDFDFQDPVARDGADPADLLYLATSFRALAAMLACLLDTGFASGPSLPPNLTGKPDFLLVSLWPIAVLASPAPDTS